MLSRRLVARSIPRPLPRSLYRHRPLLTSTRRHYSSFPHYLWPSPVPPYHVLSSPTLTTTPNHNTNATTLADMAKQQSETRSREFSLPSVLTIHQKALLTRIKSLLDRLINDLRDLDMSIQDQTLMKQIIQKMDELFLFVVVGEFNSGKSAFVNALLGAPYCQTGVLPTTEHIYILRYGDTMETVADSPSEHVRSLLLPVEWLRETNVVDTPGTNAILRSHQEITEHFVPRSDVVLFVTSVDRPFSDSESQFLERIRAWHKKVVIVLNKIDTLKNPNERQQIINFVKQNAKKVLQEDPIVFPVSAAQALQSKITLSSLSSSSSYSSHIYDTDSERQQRTTARQQLEDSGFLALESYLVSTLDADTKIRLKLETPLGIGETLLQRYTSVLQTRQQLLREDIDTLNTLNRDIDEFRRDMNADFQYQLEKMDNIFLKMLDNTDAFIAEHIKLSKLPSLLNSTQLKAKFDAQVNASVTNDMQTCISQLVDWMQDKTHRQASSTSEFLARRLATSAVVAQHQATDARMKQQLMVGRLDLSFYSNRQSLLITLQNQTRTIISDKDRLAETERLAEHIRVAVMQTAAVEAAGIGLGALVAAALMDITGLAGAGLLAISGLYILPYRRARLKREMRGRINEMRTSLASVLKKHYDTEMENAITKIHVALSPYTRFVRIESDKLNGIHRNITQLQSLITQARNDIRAATTRETVKAATATATAATTTTATITSTHNSHESVSTSPSSTPIATPASSSSPSTPPSTSTSTSTSSPSTTSPPSQSASS